MEEKKELETASPAGTLQATGVNKTAEGAQEVAGARETGGKQSHKRILVGKVASAKPNKTIIVSIERHISHPIYKKYFKSTKRFMAHDEQNICKLGDTVKIRESRPLSARKRWVLVEILERAK